MYTPSDNCTNDKKCSYKVGSYTCPSCIKYLNEEQAACKALQKANIDLLDFLEIPHYGLYSISISISDLCKILTDKEKMSKIMCKLNNKAFW